MNAATLMSTSWKASEFFRHWSTLSWSVVTMSELMHTVSMAVWLKPKFMPPSSSGTASSPQKASHCPERSMVDLRSSPSVSGGSSLQRSSSVSLLKATTMSSPKPETVVAPGGSHASLVVSPWARRPLKFSRESAPTAAKLAATPSSGSRAKAEAVPLAAPLAAPGGRSAAKRRSAGHSWIQMGYLAARASLYILNNSVPCSELRNSSSSAAFADFAFHCASKHTSMPMPMASGMLPMSTVESPSSP
mmetsp:Transcript_25131/g.63066  ORF Transcript_25131/g.63066 Transcript_25131/m.63066 type:complete len:247 (-) Transcript_25131:1024-1764(-)